ncbi:toxin-antitoxin system YwqK family antitoxin [Empedobacter falsenii]
MKLSFLILCLMIICSCSTKVRTELSDGEYKIEHFINDSIKQGKSTIYFSNGKVQRIINYRNNVINGKMKFYHNNGNLASKTIFKDGIVKDKFYNFHLNGKPYNTYVFKDNKLSDIENCFDGNSNKLDCGTLHQGNGTIKQYDLSGKLIAVDYMKNGKYQKTDSIN